VAMSTPSATERVLSRAFRPFAVVDPGEAVGAAVLTLTVFLLLTAYYLLKTAREPLILLHGGAEVKSYASAGQSIVLLFVVRAYGSIASRVGRMKLIAGIFLFFVSNLVVFAVLARADFSIGVAFYLWVGVFNVTAIAQFWSFAADAYNPEQGKRLFAVLGIGSSVGAVAGARIAKALVPLGPAGLMISAAGILVVCVVLFAVIDKRLGTATKSVSDVDEPLAPDHAFRLLMSDKYLLLIAALALILNWVNSNGEYVLDRTLLASLGDVPAKDATAFIGAFKAEYFAWVNLFGVLLQLFAVSRILTVLGVRNALLFLPAVAFIGYGAMIFFPALGLIRAAKIAENSIDYSLQTTARQALFLVASRLEKFVGKTVVDTLFVRLGDVLSAAAVWVGVQFAWPTAAFATLNIVLVVVWVTLVVVIGREQRRRLDEPDALPAVEAVAS